MIWKGSCYIQAEALVLMVLLKCAACLAHAALACSALDFSILKAVFVDC